MDEAEPDLIIGGLSLWLLGRSYPDAADPWDLDENDCLAIAAANGARVELSGVLSSRSLHFFAMALDNLHQRLEGAASLDGTDLGLVVHIKSTSLGHMVISVEMTPDYSISQSHRFAFQCDQTDLSPMLRQCRAILTRLPTVFR